MSLDGDESVSSAGQGLSASFSMRRLVTRNTSESFVISRTRIDCPVRLRTACCGLMRDVGRAV
jgi:hypothetical protein